MSGSKTKTTSNQTTTNSLPSWLTTPYQNATTAATTAAAQPAIGTATQTALSNLTNTGNLASTVGTGTINSLTGMASGNFSGTMAGNSLTGLAANGGLDTSFIDVSGLNKTASGAYLTADSNPYIAQVAQQGADAAQARINAQFGASGRSNGSGLYAQLFGQGIANATNDVYATNYSNERQLQQAAQNTLLGANQTTRENALNRQQSSAQSLIGDQISAGQGISGLLSSITAANNSAANAGEYQDNAALQRQATYAGILNQLAAPFATSTTNGTSTSKTSQSLGGTLAGLAGAGLAGWATGGFKFG